MFGLITFIILIAIGGILIGGGVHFIPVGGAPAAMATATGVGTGTAMLASGAGLTGLITAASMPLTTPLWLVLLAGAVGAMLMMGFTMLTGNFIYIFGVGVVPASSKANKDPITGAEQESFKSPGTEGHGIPTSCFISGLIGALLGGVGGGLVYKVLYTQLGANPTAGGIAAIFAVAVFFINAVIASYNIGGTTEGFQDPKFKRLPAGILSCFIASIVAGLLALCITGFTGGLF